VGTDYDAHTMPSGVPAMVMAHVKPIAINHGMCVNSSAMNAV